MPVDRSLLASRIREIRHEVFGDGDDGIAALARGLEITPRTWENFEQGVAIPDSLLLRFLAHTGVEPHWLLTGEGERYRRRPGEEGGQTFG